MGRQVSAQFAPPSEEPEAVTAMKEHLKTRMKDGEEAEQAGKAKADEEAAEFLKVPLSPNWRPIVSQDRWLRRP